MHAKAAIMAASMLGALYPMPREMPALPPLPEYPPPWDVNADYDAFDLAAQKRARKAAKRMAGAR